MQRWSHKEMKSVHRSQCTNLRFLFFFRHRRNIAVRNPNCEGYPVCSQPAWQPDEVEPALFSRLVLLFLFWKSARPAPFFLWPARVSFFLLFSALFPQPARSPSSSFCMSRPGGARAQPAMASSEAAEGAGRAGRHSRPQVEAHGRGWSGRG